MRTGFLTSILVSAPFALVGQQQRQLPPPGASIRVSHNYVCSKRPAGENSCSVVAGVAPIVVTGALRKLDADTLALTLSGGATLVLPKTSVTKLEVSRGRKSHTGKGIGYGALAGLATGTITAFVGCNIAASSGGSGCHGFGDNSYSDATGATVVAGALVGAVIGGVVGGIVGATHSAEQWEQVAF